MAKEKPAVIVVQTFGGIHPTARALSQEAGRRVSAQTVSSWLHRTGNVPYQWHQTIINAARKQQGVEITLEDLMYREK